MIWVLKHYEIPNPNKNDPLHFVYVTLAYSFTFFLQTSSKDLNYMAKFFSTMALLLTFIFPVFLTVTFLQYQNNIKHLNKERIYFVS